MRRPATLKARAITEHFGAIFRYANLAQRRILHAQAVVDVHSMSKVPF
jgi:hypothetical protein